MNVLQLHGSVGWLIGKVGQLYITLLQILYSIKLPKIENWLLVDKVIAKLTG